MVFKYFNKEYLKEELDLPFEAIKNEIIGTSRWSAFHRIVFQDKDGTYWTTGYSCGLTELQDEGPWDYDDDEIECIQVEKKKIEIEDWIPVEEEE